MALRVNTNIMALQAQRNLGVSNLALQKTFERLSSGLRINRAADDAAGLAISEKLRAQIRGYNQSVNNAQDGINLIQTAEGALNESTTILHRIRELAIQASNDTNTQSEREKIQEEITQLRLELTKIATTTEFNTRKLLDGSSGESTKGRVANIFVGQNIRIGDVNATIPDIRDLITRMQLVTASNSDIALATVDAAFQFKIISWQDSVITDPISTAIEVRSSVDGLLTTIRLGLAVVPSQISLTIGATDIATIGINNLVSLCDIGKTALVQVNARKDPVTVDNALTFHVGPNEGQFIKVGIDDMTSKTLRLESVRVMGTTDEDSKLKAQDAIGVVDDALERINILRAKLGAIQNRLESSIRNMSIASENLSSSESQIRDADMAKETTNLTRAQILVQAGTAILAQANVNPQSALQLLGG